MITKYERRLEQLHKFIHLKAPTSIIYFSAQTLLLTSTNDLRYKLIWRMLKEALYLTWTDISITIQLKFYRLYLTQEEIEEKIFPK